MQANSNNDITTASIGKLFASGARYVIPVYQRNYAWGDREISQLVQDIFDFSKASKGNAEAKYYIGTLVVYERHLDNETIFETIDGQQRLTTLNIVLSACHRLYKNQLEAPIDYKLNLAFDSRQKSTETLAVIASEHDELQYLQSKDYNPNIQQGYADAEKALNKLLKSQEQIRDFYQTLTQKVYLMRVSVPADTDLNHYFEIMNNRGEQLEKHEILKAKMLEVLHKDKALSHAFNLIWEACADMERYVQYGFNTTQRSAIFKNDDWNSLQCNSLEEIAEKLDYKPNDGGQENGNIDKALSLEAIVGHDQRFELNEDHKDDAPERFNSVINFPNFLLHVLRIQVQTNSELNDEGKDISLDDKRLIDLFDPHIKGEIPGENKLDFVKTFGFNLLKCKFLFDKYILKREFYQEKDRWSLKRLKWYKDNRVSYVNTFGEEEQSNEGLNQEILMLLAMFHVSAPTLVYKHWLNASLNFVFRNGQVTAEAYRNFLKQLAKAFLFDRYLAEEKELDYYHIIYKNGGIAQNQVQDLDTSLLDQGTAVENFVFNYLDFILWDNKATDHQKFDFSFRSSVEHYYPQNPISGDKDKLEQAICDQFGNLCLISNSKNSKLSNYLPEAKKDHYRNVGADSLKQRKMMESEFWGSDEISQHGKEMKEFLLTY